MLADFDRQQFALEIEKLAITTLSGEPPGSIFKSARLVQELADRYHQDCIGQDDRIDCRAGCDHCCIVNVSVLFPEALSIADHLITVRSSAQLNDLYKKLSTLDLDTRDLDDEERIMVRRKCAFLNQQGSCDIYPFRPLLCRAVTSTDAAACKESLAMVALDEETPILSNLLQQEIYESAFSGLGAALEKTSMDNRSFRLTGSIHSILKRHLQETVHSVN